jgi:adenine phosphoribosyltransferase
MAAACKIIEKIGGQIVGVSFLIELTGLSGRDKLASYTVKTVISY